MKPSPKSPGFILSAIALAVTALAGCNNNQAANNSVATSSDSVAKHAQHKPLPWDFAGMTDLQNVTLTAAGARVINTNIDGDGEQKLAIDLHSKEHKSAGFSFIPDTPWDWSQEGQFAFAIDIENPSSASVHLYVSAKDAEGQSHNRSFVVPGNSSDTYFMALNDPDLSIETDRVLWSCLR